MKKVSLFLFLSATILFTSCEKDSNENPENNVKNSEESILGLWELTAYTVENGTSVTETPFGDITQEYSSIGKDFEMQIEFSSDPNVVTSTGSFLSETTITVMGQTQVSEIPLYTAFNSSTWEIRDDVLFFIDEDGKETEMNTIESTESKLILSSDFDQEVELQDGITTKATGKLTVTMEK